MLSSCVWLVFALLRCVDDFLESRFLFVGLCFLVFVDCVRVLESVELDSESNSKTLNLGSTPLGLCLCSLFRISLDSVITLESVGLDSVNVLDSVLPRFSALDSESALDSVDSKFLRVVFSRILPRFSKSFCFFAKRGVIPSPLAKAPKKPPLFRQPKVYLLAGEPRLSLSRQNEVSLEKSAAALLPPFS